MSDDTSGETSRKLTEIAKVGSGTAESLRDAGFESVADVRDADADELTEAEGVGEARATEIKENADALADDADGGADQAAAADGGEAAAQSEEAEEDESDDADAEADEDGGDEEESGDDEDASADEDDENPPAEDLDMMQVKDTVQDVAETLIDDPFDGIIEIEQDEEGWYAVVEVIERSAVPDTQDILGRYEIDLDGEGSVLGYRLTDRYRRGDVSRDE